MKRWSSYLYYRAGGAVFRWLYGFATYLKTYRRSQRRNSPLHPRILVFWVVWFAAGIAVAETFHPRLETAAGILAGVLAAACISLYRSRWMRGRGHWLVLFSLGMVVWALQLPPQPLAAWLEPVRVSAVITKINSVEENRIQAVIQLKETHAVNSESAVRYLMDRRNPLQRPWLVLLNIYLPTSEEAAYGADEEVVQTPWRNLIVPGRMVRFHRALRLPKDSGNPGLFDYRAYLRRQGITATVSLRWQDLEVGELSGYRFNRAIYRLGRFLKEKMQRLLPERHGIIAGLILGDTSAITPRDEAAFRKAGVSHILSVSGLHVGFVYVLVAWLVKRLHLGRRWEFIFTALGLGGFVLLAGAKAPAVRAALGILGGLLLQDGRRRPDNVALVLASSLVILAMSPLSLFDVGFQLSYAAVLGIIILTPRLQRILPSNRLGQGMAVSLAASLSTMPICAYYFFTVSLVGPVANLIIVPLVSLIMPLAMIGLSLQTLVPSLAALLSHPLDYLVRALIRTAHMFSSLPGAEVVVGQPRPFWLVLYYVGLFWAVRQLDLLVYVPRQCKLRVWLSITLVVLAWWLWTPALAASLPEFCLTVVDVGQGDCFFVWDRQGLEVLIDGGGTDPKYSSFNVGERISLPFLYQRGVARVDLVVNTHPHYDHLAGLLPVVAKTNPKVTIDNGCIHPSRVYSEWQRLVGDSIHHITFREAQTVRVASGRTWIEIVQPLHNDNVALNNSSLVTKVTWGPWSILLTGDLETEGTRALLMSGFDLSADILQIPHHGGSNHYLASLIEAVNPQVVFISVGNNYFGHPAAGTLAMLEKRNIPLLRTDRDGAISFAVTPESRIDKRGAKAQVSQLVVTTSRGKTIVLEK